MLFCTKVSESYDLSILIVCHNFPQLLLEMDVHDFVYNIGFLKFAMTNYHCCAENKKLNSIKTLPAHLLA